MPEHKASVEHPWDGPAGKRLVRGRVVKWEFVLLLQTLPRHAELLLEVCLEEGGGLSISGCFDADGMFVIFLGNLVNTSIYVYTHIHIYMHACTYLYIYVFLYSGGEGLADLGAIAAPADAKSCPTAPHSSLVVHMLKAQP